MNNRFLRFGKKTPMDRKKKNILLSIAILFELILLCTVMSYAWVETISSIKLNNLDPDGNDLVPNTKVNESYVHTRVHLTEAQNTVDLGKYFRQAGDMHLSPASSANGESFFFPQTASSVAVSGTQPYRPGTIDDKNTTYMSVTFKLTTEAYSAIYFSANPTFSALSSDIRVSVKAVSDDPATYGSRHDTAEEYAYNNTVVFYKNNTATSTATNVANVVGGADGVADDTQTAHTFYEFTSAGGKKLFTVNGNETMTVTINLWLQKKSTDMDSVMSVSNLEIKNLGITSGQESTTISLIPTGSGNWSNKYYYVWSFDNDHDNVDAVLQQFSLNQTTGHYTVKLNSGLPGLLFFSSSENGLTKEQMDANNNAKWSTVVQTDDLNFADIPNTLNPTFVITSDGTAGGTKAGGNWVDPVEINVAYITGQSASTCGSIKVTTYTDTTSTRKMEESNTTSDSPHFRKAHGWNGKKFKLGATAASGWQFVGWYSDAAGTNLVSSTNAYNTNISTAAGGTKTYYARFKEVRTIRLYKYLDGTNTSSTSNSIKINSGTAVTSASTNATVDKGSTVTLSATAASGYTLTGFYTTSAGGDSNKITPETTSGSTKSVTITANSSNVTANYFALFTTNYYNVTAHACYSTDNGSSYTENNATGGTVKVGDASVGATSTESVKFNTSVALTATAKAGYEFVGWRLGSTSGTTVTSPYNLNTAGEKHIYALFKSNRFTVTAKAYYKTTGSYTAGDTGGTVKAGSADPGATSATDVTVNSAVTLRAYPEAGYIFDGWYTASSGGTAAEISESYSYTLTAYSNKTLFARFRKGDFYLTGYINKTEVLTDQAAYKFTHHATTANTYTLTIDFTDDQDGNQYVLVKDGSTVHHPTDINSGSGTAATGTDSNANGDPKWMIGATKLQKATITWNYKTKVLSWTVTTPMKWFYFEVGNCSWFGDSDALPSVKYSGDSSWHNASLVSGTLYKVQMPSKITQFQFARRTAGGSGPWNERTVTTSGTNNKYTINSNNNGGTWSTVS